MHVHPTTVDRHSVYTAGDGTSQIHTYAGGIDHDIDHHMVLDFSGIVSFSHGHHARAGGGRDIFDFTNLGEIRNTVIGRLEDFDPTRDEIRIEGEALDLNALPSNVRIVEFNGAHNDPGAEPQKWLLIDTGEGHLFYALDGARIDMDNNGDANSGTQERHFLQIQEIPDFSALKDVVYENPMNYAPFGSVPDGGIVINDTDANAADVLATIEGTSGGDVIAAGLNSDVVQAGNGRDVVYGGDGHDTVSGGAGNDTLNGNAGADRLFGGAGSDALDGGAGDDVLNGDGGADTMAGGAGNDTYWVNEAGDLVFEDAHAGHDLVNASVSFSLRDSGQHIEDLTLIGVGDIAGVGNGRNNVIRGNDGSNNLNGAWGDDTLYGGAGHDTFNDESGADLMVGGTGDDRYFVDDAGDVIIEEANQGYDLVYAGLSFSLRSFSQHIEALKLTGDGDFAGVGNGQDNVIQGNDGNNALNGAWGNDTLIGGAGDDTFDDDRGQDLMVGGSGNDLYHVDAYGDVVLEEANEGYDVVHSTVSFSLRTSGQHVEDLILEGSEDIYAIGNGEDNVIRGNDGNNAMNGAWGNDTLIGGAGDDVFNDDQGADRMVGGTGNDIYHVDHNGDVVVEESNEGFDVVHSTVSFSLRSSGKHIEDLILEGSEDIYGLGNGHDNVIEGNTGDNNLDGAWGNDTLIGGAGDDTFFDPLGNELMTGGAGSDTFVFADNFGQDEITDFDASAGDRIDFSALGGIADFADLVANHLSQTAAGTVINVAGGDSLTLAGVNMTELGDDAFIF